MIFRALRVYGWIYETADQEGSAAFFLDQSEHDCHLRRVVVIRGLKKPLGWLVV